MNPHPSITESDFNTVAVPSPQKLRSLGLASAFDCERRTIWIADAHRGDGKLFVVRADEKLSAFLELESTIRRAIATTTR
jgi:hypothetical protein